MKILHHVMPREKGGGARQLCREKVAALNMYCEVPVAALGTLHTLQSALCALTYYECISVIEIESWL